MASIIYLKSSLHFCRPYEVYAIRDSALLRPSVFRLGYIRATKIANNSVKRGMKEAFFHANFYTLKDDPHPQVVVALGLRITN